MQIAKELYCLAGLNQVLCHLQSGRMAADVKTLDGNGLLPPCPYHSSVAMRAAAMYKALLQTRG